MKHLIDFIDAWQPRRIAVLGDYMLDHSIYGNAERLSPDAPVPVLAVEREQFTPGGASNVCMDLRALRCEVDCIGVTGDDLTAAQLRRCLGESGCNVDGLIAMNDRPTTVKRSYIGLAQHRHPQKMFRADFEKRAAVTDGAAKKLIDAVKRSLSTADALCIEDYNKGVCTAEVCQAAIAAAQAAGVPVLVDPAANCLRTGAAPGLPDTYNRAVDGIGISSEVGTCAAAAALSPRT